MAYTDIDDPSAYFQTVLYTGDNANTKAITFDGNSDLDLSSGGLWWGKTRSTARNHQWIDSIRGVTKTLQSNVTNAELSSDSSGFLASFNSNGFTTQKGSYDNGNVNMSGRTYVNWCWKAGTSFTNDASGTGIGSIDSAGSVSTDAGFSIITYTGTGSNGTIAHGLGVKPNIIINKTRDTTAQMWSFYHSSLGATKHLGLDRNNAEDTGSAYYQNTEPTSTVFSVGSESATNHNGAAMIAYCFAEKQGYSKFGSFVSNNTTNNAFTYCGFKPALVLLKSTTSTNDWMIFDNKRDPFNVTQHKLYPNGSDAEATTENDLDFLSNGFKLRAAHGANTFIFMAFAENPFTTSTGVPATAR